MKSLNKKCLTEKTYNMRTESTLGVIFFTRNKRNDPEKLDIYVRINLKKYVREMMKDYAASFIRNQKVNVDSIKYYAKIEHQRTYRGFEKQVVENAPYRKKIANLNNDIRKVERGEIDGSVKKLERQIEKLNEEAPHKHNGQLIVARN